MLLFLLHILTYFVEIFLIKNARNQELVLIISYFPVSCCQSQIALCTQHSVVSLSTQCTQNLIELNLNLVIMFVSICNISFSTQVLTAICEHLKSMIQ